MRTIATVLAVGLVLYAGACLALYLVQRSLIYFPQPGRAGAAAAPLTLDVPGARINITARPLAGPHAVLYFGGNAEDVSANLPSMARTFPRHALYFVHYRGFGGSTGTMSEQAAYADALAAYDRIRTEHPHVTVIGRSIGSAVALYLASMRPVANLVLVTPFDSVVEIASRQFPLFPVRWLLKDKFESWRHAPKIGVPTLILAAGEDEIVPRASSERLASRFKPGVASYQVIPGTGHNTISEHPAYDAALARIADRP